MNKTKSLFKLPTDNFNPERLSSALRHFRQRDISFNRRMSGINRHKEMLAIIVLLEHSGMKISKTAQTGQYYEVASSGKGGIIKSSGVFENNIDSHIPEDNVIYRKNEQGKTIAINSESGEVSGCGSEIDK